MALTDTATTPHPTKGNISRTGNHHSIRVKDGMRINRLIRRDLVKLVKEQVRLATEAESESVRQATGQYLINRVIGLPAAAPEDAMAAAAAVIQVLSGIARRPTDPVIDVTPQASPELPSKSLISQDIPAADQP